jgi:hypothetical protein
LSDLLENEMFCIGLAVGICLYQRAVVAAQKNKKPLKIGDNLYYVQDGRERLAEVLDKVCRCSLGKSMKKQKKIMLYKWK